MNNIAREKLLQITNRFGISLCDDPRRCEGLLRDLCGDYKREINLLISAMKEQVPANLLSSKGSIPWELLLNRLTRRLQDNLGLTEEAASWTVESWALALGVIGADEIAQSRPQPAVEAQPIAAPQPSSQERPQIALAGTKQPEKNKSELAKANRYIKIALILGYLHGGIMMLVFFSVKSSGTFIIALIYFGLSSGIYNKSKLCSIIIFCLTVILTILLIIGGSSSDKKDFGLLITLSVFMILFSYLFYRGMQGIFTYHKLVNKKT
jgi:hypothetical protein